METCRDCGQMKMHGNWTPSEDPILDLIKTTMDNKNIKKYTIEEIKGDPYRVFYAIHVQLPEPDIEFEIRIKHILCEKCSKKRGGYYEAKVQLRGNIPEEWEDAVQDARIEKIRGGFDLYFFSITQAMLFAKSFGKKHKAEKKESRKLYTVKDGKKIYKTTILLRFV